MMSPNMRGALMMSLAMSAFVVNDTMTKWTSETIGAGQTMFIRGIFATVILIALAMRHGAHRDIISYKHPRIMMRTLFEVIGTVTFFIGLPNMPIATLSAIYQSLPLVVTLGAALFLAEPVGWRRWLAIIVGLCGVLIIIRPGSEGFNIFAVIVVLSVFASAARDLVTRTIDISVPASGIAALTSAAITIIGFIMMMVQGGFKPVNFQIISVLMGAAVLLTIAYQTIILAMRYGEISFVAPFRYLSLLIAIVLGYLVFSETPDAMTYLGATIVVGSGIYTLYREQIRKGDRADQGNEIAAESTGRPMLAPIPETIDQDNAAPIKPAAP